VYRLVYPLFFEFARRFPGRTVTSFYRDPINNRRVGGARFSQHLLALAFDSVGPDDEGARAFADALGLVAIREPTHLHVQAFPAGFIPPRFFSLTA